MTSRSAWLQPRDHAVAARTIATLCLVAALVTIVFSLAEPGEKTSVATIAITVGVAVAAICASWLLRHLRPDHSLIWACAPFLAIAVIVGLDLLTADGSIAAQVFLFFPALYGGSELKRPGALTVTVAALVGELIVITVTLSPGTAVIDGVYVGAALTTTAFLLIRGGERQDSLIAQLSRQAAIDPLTGPATRRVLDHAAQAALTGAASDEGTALVILDIDNFKTVNDERGHLAGDEVLVQLADLLTAGCRPNDVVGRLGGDEIALLLPGCSPQALVRRADQLMWDVRAHIFALSEGPPLNISVSAGFAHAPTDAQDLRSLYAAADAALYDAKRSGRDRVGTIPASSTTQARLTTPAAAPTDDRQPAGARPR